jgi:hypothetical protein
MAGSSVDSMAKTCGIMLLALALFVPSCRDSSQDGGSGQSGQPDSNDMQDSNGDQDNAAHPSGWVPIPIKLPEAVFRGTPPNIDGVKNLEKPLGTDRPPFYAPAGVDNVAAGKTVTSSDPAEPITGYIYYVTDGDKEAIDGSLLELAPFKQHVTIDLGDVYEIYAILCWHDHRQACVYFDVVVQIADDPDFVANVRTLFNNDDDNSSGLGTGSDKNYVETSEGKLINAKGAKARYVRLYSNGNNSNELNHYIEVEVFGKPAK